MMFPFYPFPTSQLTSLTSCLNISTEFNWGVPWSHGTDYRRVTHGDPVGLADWQVATEWWLCWNATALPDLRDLTAWESMGKHGKAMLAGLKLKHLKYPEMLILYFINLHHISSLSISATVLVSCASCRDILIASWRTCRFVAPARQCRKIKSQDRSVVKTASADGKALAPWPCKRSSAWKGVGSFAVMCTLVKRWSLRSRRRITW